MVDKETGEKTCGHPYPVPFLLAVLGYTLILVLDKVLIDSDAVLHADEPANPFDTNFVRKTVTRASLVA